MDAEIKSFTDKVLADTGFFMVNPVKVTRAVFGLDTSSGKVGGVGENADSKTILAEYDKLGGYITKNAYKVKPRTFFDIKAARRNQLVVIEKPVITLLIKVNGVVVEQVEGEPETLEVQIAKKQITEEVKEKKVKKGKKVKDEE